MFPLNLHVDFNFNLIFASQLFSLVQTVLFCKGSTSKRINKSKCGFQSKITFKTQQYKFLH